MMSRRLFIAASTAALAHGPAQAAGAPSAQVLETMRRATRFMTEKVAVNGGYVWSYLPDMSRRWGEMEAKPSMIWVQSPGTPGMGHLFLDAFHATGDEQYYKAAEDVAGALIWGQHPSGGWHYMIDFAGEASLKDWYDTIGSHGMRLEEMRHYYGNATFDDGGTIESAEFLLRLYLERRDPKYRVPLDKAIDFVIDAQYPIGGWPQRYPINREYSNGGLPDYTANITFNDEVAINNTNFLMTVYQALGETRVLEPLMRGMGIFILAQQGQPQPGWALQYTSDLKPAGARTSEPPSLATHTTAACVAQMIKFYRWTGDTKYLARLDEALDWLDTLELPKVRQLNGFTHPTFIEVGTNRALYLKESGTWSGDMRNTVVYDPTDGVSWVNRKLNVPALRRQLQAVTAMPKADATRHSPLLSKTAVPLDKYFIADVRGSDRNTGDAMARSITELTGSLNPQGYWPTPLHAISNVYRPDAEAARLPPSRTANGNTIDARDTSPYIGTTPVMGISTGTYINNMSRLIRFIDASAKAV
ncbi:MULTISPECIES: pectate lyase [Asticcacaulis]|uniref:pectate lyase n=1 Tax=Asticcacaulis TaxID=76890 RepID=UPI001AE0F2A9|nr:MULTISPECIES: pectate lyase [Asticcacaulis]MBP2161150.1 PelA/Pel-15E family pectate lyase [Asticcacaulis solisilvae]MDR6802195.1 PelA/Pel-15E family pectate lyase [Asticcacaulis sp. BE141]